MSRHYQNQVRTSKQNADTRLLRHLAGALCDARAIDGVREDNPAIRALAGALTLQDRAMKDVELDMQTLGDLLVTDEPRLLRRIAEDGRPIQLQSYQWRRLMRATSPDRLRKHLTRKTLSPHGATAHLFSKIMQGKDGWGEILDLTTQVSTAPDPHALDASYRELMAHPRVTRHAAMHLRAQVSRFADHYAEMGKYAMSQGDAFLVLLLHRAGVPFRLMASTSSRKPPLRALLDQLLHSSHGKLKLHALCPNLETALRTYRAVEQSLQESLQEYASRST